MTTAKKLLKHDGLSEEKRSLQLGLQQLEATMALMKAVVKPSGTYLETASCYDTLKLVRGTASEGCARTLLDRNVDDRLTNGDAKGAIALMTKHAGAPHALHELLPEEKIPEAQMSIAAKVAQATFKYKVLGPMDNAQREAADVVVLFKHDLGFESFSGELKKQIEVMFACMHSSCVEAASISEATAFASRFPVPDARKPPESPFAAFLLSKVGKQAVKSLALLAETAAKADSASRAFAQLVESIKDFTKLESISLSLLQLEVMPLLRKAKKSCKGADPAVVQEMFSTTRSLFVNFGTDLFGRMNESAPFLFKEVELMKATPAPAEEFQKNVSELKAVDKWWHEIHTDIAPFCVSAGPAAIAATAVASSLADISTFIMYAELAQEVASMDLSEASAPALESLASRLVDLLQPETWQSLEALVTGLTLETSPYAIF